VKKKYNYEECIGKTFNRLTVLDVCRVNGKLHFLCRCSCGNVGAHEAYSVVDGKIKSCGCLQKESTSKHNIKNYKKYNQYDLSGEFGIGYFDNSYKKFYFDLEDYDKIKNYHWYYSKDGYCYSTGRKYKMHRIILNAKKGEIVDHIDHNKIDNRKSNIRICTQSQNMHNARNGNKYKGTYKTKYGKYEAHIRIGGKRIRLGIFDTIDEAHSAYCEATTQYYGDYVCFD